MNKYILEYNNENEFRKMERNLKRFNMLAYKKLMFDNYPSLKEGKFLGKVIGENKQEGINQYEFELPTDTMFAKVHGKIRLYYSVNKPKGVITLEKFEPEEIMKDRSTNELSTYKGVILSRNNPDKDIFKINLLNMLNDKK